MSVQHNDNTTAAVAQLYNTHTLYWLPSWKCSRDETATADHKTESHTVFSSHSRIAGMSVGV